MTSTKQSALLAATSTLLGAALGVGATLFVGQVSISADRDREVRESRHAAYTALAATLPKYIDESVKFYETRDQHCQFEVTVKGKSGPTCMMYVLTGDFMTARSAWLDAVTAVRIFGSDDAVKAINRLDELMDSGNTRYARPWGAYVDEMFKEPSAEEEEDVTEVQDEASELMQDFDLLTCVELNGNLSRSQCAERFG
ncbi:hypothetical protein [Aeromicrobium erythreum]|uniref:Uncharacterized protein n=1 Tax=Aeromicrobium erythreum TaxID=2041 RepID=A0A0U4CHH9_9ACTN|nr:hypothetical protein [Aeromicrobium erythreum]ALX04837.1 hypothetical protein AERYTH_09065 [Aeromicrobium erythreum]